MNVTAIDQLRATAALTATSPDTDSLRLLHVEDNPADALLMQEYIRGVLPTVTFDTAERMSEVTRDRVAAADCALLDLSLPDASGLEGLAVLRRLSENVPIIVLTGFDDMELGLSAVRDGADDYLLKNHVDGYTLERAVQYAIERRRLMLQLAQSAAEAIIATASTITAEAAAAVALEQVRDGEADAWAGVGVEAAVGTHQVAVRVDRSTAEFVLQCQSCDWQSERGPDGLHSWAARSLEMTLLSHIDFEHEGRTVAAARSQAGSPVQRRSIFRPRGWVG